MEWVGPWWMELSMIVVLVSMVVAAMVLLNRLAREVVTTVATLERLGRLAVAVADLGSSVRRFNDRLDDLDRS